MTFNIGDRVRVASGQYPSSLVTVGTYLGNGLVEFDEYFGGHSGTENTGRNGHCWYISSTHLTLAEFVYVPTQEGDKEDDI